jgi:hypothetical protein
MLKEKQELLHALASIRDDGERLNLPLFTHLLDMAIEDLCEKIDGVEKQPSMIEVPQHIAMNYFANTRSNSNARAFSH